jgi:hypothetical protein
MFYHVAQVTSEATIEETGETGKTGKTGKSGKSGKTGNRWTGKGA